MVLGYTRSLACPPVFLLDKKLMRYLVAYPPSCDYSVTVHSVGQNHPKRKARSRDLRGLHRLEFVFRRVLLFLLFSHTEALQLLHSKSRASITPALAS